MRQSRRTPPSLVSMWMLDVFCCALGCVTLLWLLNTREAKQEATRATAALADLTESRSNLAAAKADADASQRQLNSQIEELRGKLVATMKERDDLNKQLLAAKDAITQALAKSTLLDEQLTKKQQEAKEVASKLTLSTASLEQLTKLLRSTEEEREQLKIKTAKLDEKLADADARIRIVTQESKTAKDSLAAMKKTGDELSMANNSVADLKKQLEMANVNIIDLQGDKKKLADKYDKLKVDTDSKFAGIAMTGKKIAFLVDISGSMKLSDEKTPDSTKWPIVCETVAKVMRSIPELEQFQVITFSRSAEYLFPTGFQQYRGEESIQSVLAKLKSIEPVADTNLYAGLDLAFRLRSSELDTVYVFSDGLPTSGPGLTSEQNTLPDFRKSEVMAKFVRDQLKREWNLSNSRGQRVKINTIGFFYESPDVGAFLWALARENDGSFVGMSKP